MDLHQILSIHLTGNLMLTEFDMLLTLHCSSHMMLTSMQLWAEGITFASVHDCFWTHASDIEAMNR